MREVGEKQYKVTQKTAWGGTGKKRKNVFEKNSNNVGRELRRAGIILTTFKKKKDGAGFEEGSLEE